MDLGRGKRDADVEVMEVKVCVGASGGLGSGGWELRVVHSDPAATIKIGGQVFA